MRMIGSPALTIKIMRDHHGIKIDRLICGRYAGVGRVLETGYKYDEGRSPSDYDANNPTGYRTGQWITVQVVDGAMLSHRKGEKIEGIWSYGGDTGIIGKPKVGDFVGFYYGNYAQLWEKLSPFQVRMWQRRMAGGGVAAPRKPLPSHRPIHPTHRDKATEKREAVFPQKPVVECMENSWMANRIGSILGMILILAGASALGFFVIYPEWSQGSFPWETIVWALMALACVLYAVWKLYCHIVRFSEKPEIIRGMVLKKTIEIERTYDDSGGMDERVSDRFIRVGKYDYSLKEEVFNWLSVGDVVELTYYPSIEEVTLVRRISTRRSFVSRMEAITRLYRMAKQRSLIQRIPIGQRPSRRGLANRDQK